MNRIIISIPSFTVLVLFSCIANAQEKTMEQYEPHLFGKAYVERFVGRGDPYFSYWADASVYFEDGTEAHHKKIRYNGLLDEMIWMRDKDFQLAIVARKNIKAIKFYPEGEDAFQFVKLTHKNPQHPENNDIYLQLLAHGEVSLLKKFEVFENSTTSELEKRTVYFLKKEEEIKRIALSKAIVSRAFKTDKKKFQQILKENKLSPSRERDLIKAIELFNTN